MSAIDLKIHVDIDQIVERLKEEGWVIPVRCRDCAHASESRRKIYGAFYCEKLVDFFPADHYCGYGKPREDGEDDG